MVSVPLPGRRRGRAGRDGRLRCARLSRRLLEAPTGDPASTRSSWPPRSRTSVRRHLPTVSLPRTIAGLTLELVAEPGPAGRDRPPRPRARRRRRAVAPAAGAAARARRLRRRDRRPRAGRREARAGSASTCSSPTTSPRPGPASGPPPTGSRSSPRTARRPPCRSSPKREVAERILDRVVAALDARDAAAQTGGRSSPHRRAASRERHPQRPRPPHRPGLRPDVRRRRAHRDAHRLRLPDGPARRRGRDPLDPGRRLAGAGAPRLRHDGARDDGGDAPPHEGRRARHAARAGHRRHAVPVVHDPGGGPRQRRSLPARGRAPRRSRSRAASRSARIIEALVKAGIPVMAHIGLTPQAINALGKVRVQGKSREQARALLHDGLAVQEAGAFAVVLELVPEQLAAAITARLRIPTIGIGAGAGCAGQIQVITDVLGLGSFVPRHARPYADLRGTILAAATAYRADVEAGTFPGDAQATRMDEAILDEVLGRARRRPGRDRRRDRRGDPARPRPVTAGAGTSRDPRTGPGPPRRPLASGAGRRAGAGAAAAGPGPHDGLAPRRPPLADRAGARRVRQRGRLASSSTRASSAIRPTSPSTRATRRATSPSAPRRAPTSSGPRRSRTSIRPASTRR